MTRLLRTLWHELAVPSLLLALLALLLYLVGAEPWRDPAGRH